MIKPATIKIFETIWPGRLQNELIHERAFLPRKISSISLVIFENMIDISRRFFESTCLKSRWEFKFRLWMMLGSLFRNSKPARVTSTRIRTASDKFLSLNSSEFMNRISLEGGFLLAALKVICVARNDDWKKPCDCNDLKHRDGQDLCTVSPLVAVQVGTRRVRTEMNKIWGEVIGNGEEHLGQGKAEYEHRKGKCNTDVCSCAVL